MSKNSNYKPNKPNKIATNYFNNNKTIDIDVLFTLLVIAMKVLIY